MTTDETHAIREWLGTLYGRSPGYWALTLFKHGRVTGTKWFDTTAETLDKVAPAIERVSATHDVYASVATHREPQTGGSRGNIRSVLSIPGYWADLDIGTDGHKPAELPNPVDVDSALTIVEDLPRPSGVIHSGGGLQVWWMFDHPWVFEDPAEASAASEAWQRRLVAEGERRGYHVDSIGDLPRILRVPGTQNHKLDTPRPVSVRSLDALRKYPSAELSQFGVSARSVDSGSPEKSERSGEPDDFPLSWAEILEPHGWNSYSHNLWWRPGKSRHEGHSATTDYEGTPVMVNFSASSGLPTGAGQKLTKLRVYAHLNHDGDIRAAMQAIEAMQAETPDEDADLAAIAERFEGSRVKWSEFWSMKNEPPEWFCEPLIERGRQVALYSGSAKDGKSLLMQEICQQLVRGLPTLGRPKGTEHAPIRILYIDKENTVKDLHERYTSKMGGTPDTWDLDGLVYYSFPSLAWMDTPQGGKEVHALARYHRVDLVVVDTLSRVVEGKINDPDTPVDFYRHTGERLKRDGIALVRLDHAGKDVSKGQLGSVNKTTDVDEVWQLTNGGEDDKDTLYLKRTHTRTSHGADSITVYRKDGPLRHEIEGAQVVIVDDGLAAAIGG